MDYVIIKRSTVDEVTKRVLKLSQQGFKPQGGVSVSIAYAFGERRTVIVQAMIKE